MLGSAGPGGARRPRARLAKRGEALLLWGEHDVTAEPVGLAARFDDGNSRRSAVIVHGAGHWVQYERPREVNDLLRERFREKADPTRRENE